MKRILLIGTAVIVFCGLLAGCDDPTPQQDQAATAVGEVHETHAKVETGIDGLTIEQGNIKKRLENDNKPGATKYLYLISPFSGDVISYSAVKGKVTSSGKRLKPKDQVNEFSPESYKTGYYLTEQMGDDGAFGSSSEYLYWWDLKGIYRQVSPGACAVLITDQPIRVKKSTLRLDSSSGE